MEMKEDTRTHILQDKSICKIILIKGHKTLFPTASTPPKSLSLKKPYLTALKGEQEDCHVNRLSLSGHGAFSRDGAGLENSGYVPFT